MAQLGEYLPQLAASLLADGSCLTRQRVLMGLLLEGGRQRVYIRWSTLRLSSMLLAVVALAGLVTSASAALLEAVVDSDASEGRDGALALSSLDRLDSAATARLFPSRCVFLHGWLREFLVGPL